MPQITQNRQIEVRPQDKEVVIKLDITFNVNLATGQISIGAEQVPSQPAQNKTNSAPQIKNLDFIIPKFEETTQLIDGFGEN